MTHILVNAGLSRVKTVVLKRRFVKYTIGMKSLQYGETGGRTDIGLVRLVAVLMTDGEDQGMGNFLRKRRS